MSAAEALGGSLRTELERVLAEAAGIALSSVVGRDVEAGLAAAAGLLGISREALVARLAARDPASVVALLESVLVHESHFFRHPEQLLALGEAVLAVAPRARPLALWSAGCAAGEEAYTLAMALVEAGRERCPDRIVATDVSSIAIAAAREGVYGEWSLRQLGEERRRRFFSPCGAHGTHLSSVVPAIRARVELRIHELVRDPAPGAGFDVVTCRNVLVYLSPPAAERVLGKLVDALAPGGVLVLSPAELGFARGLPLEVEERGAGVLLRKPRSPASGTPRIARPPAGRAAPRAVRSQEAPRPPSREPPRAAPEPVSTPSPVPPPREAAAGEPYERARAAARRGELDVAERLAREVAERERRPDAYLLVAAAADARGDLAAAAEAARRALYLDPGFVQAHAALVGIYRRLGRADDARRARRNAMALLDALDGPVSLPGVEEITVGALRVALEEARE